MLIYARLPRCILMSKPSDLVQETLDLLVLTIFALEPLHGWAISQRLRQVRQRCCRSVTDHCTRRCTSWNRKAGSKRIGKLRRTTGASNSMS